MRTAVIALLSAAVLAAGCGGGSPDADETVSGAMTALAKGDASGVCGAMTAAAQRKVLRVLANNPLGFPDIRARTCEEAIGKLYRLLTPPIRNALVDGEVEDVQSSDDRAKVRIVGFGMQADVRKIDGTWKIVGGLFTRPSS